MTRSILFALALSATICVAQDASSPEVRRGVIPTPAPPRVKSDRAHTYIQNKGELKKLGLFPPTYSYSASGDTEGKRFVVSRLELVAPDGSRTLTLKRFEQAANVEFEGPRLVVELDAPHVLVTNPFNRLQQCLHKHVTKKGPGNYTVRGWTAEITEAGSVRRLALLDGIHAKAFVIGKTRWAYEVRPTGYKAGIKSHTYLEGNDGVHTGYASGLVRFKRKNLTPKPEAASGLSSALKHQ